MALECESPVKEVVVGAGLVFVGMRLTGTFLVDYLLSLESN